MLRRLNVRTRLVAVIALPLLLLLAVAVPEALQRRERATTADRAAAANVAAADVAAAVDALQAERTLSAAHRAGVSREVEGSLRDQRVRTDTSAARADAAMADLADLDPSVAEAVSQARNQLAGLEAARTESDASDSIVPWRDRFEPVLGALLDVQEAVGSVVNDLDVGTQLSLVGLLARAKDATAAQAAQVAAAATWGQLRGDQVGILTDQRASEAAFKTAYLAGSPAERRAERRTELASGAATAAGRTVDQLIGGAQVGTLNTWLDLSASRQLIFRDVEAARAAEALDTATAIEASSRRSSNGYLALAGTALLLALALAFAAARSITRPLRELTEAADHLAQDQLPQLVETLRNPAQDGEHAAVLQPISVGSSDELGQLADSFNAVQSVAVDVAAEQAALLRKGISDLFVNLARRNQSLIDRQILLLDQLEADEQDAEVLDHLYMLDHMATRMRRNAESLLILAGAESGPRRSKPIELVDVVRAALSEVEQYERVELGTVAAATLHGPAVSDVAHLVAELIENATQFSPPESVVRIDASRAGSTYQLVITDRGVGMPPDQLEELNRLLREPPVTGLALGRSLGCLVAARLAARHGITVRLRAGEHGGVAAYVILPRHLLVDDAAWVSEGAAPDSRASAAVSAPEPWPAAPLAGIERIEPTDVPALLSDILPVRSAFDAGLQALLDGGIDGPVMEPPASARPEAPPTDERAAGPLHSLQRRIPGATAEAQVAPAEEPRVRRSPEEVRALLSRYRSGLEAGRVFDGPADEEQP